MIPSKSKSAKEDMDKGTIKFYLPGDGEDTTDEFVWKEFGSKRKCKVALLFSYANKKNIDISQFIIDTTLRETSGPPMEALHALKVICASRMIACEYTVDSSSDPRVCIGKLCIEKYKFQTSRPLLKDHRYCRNKVAAELLKQCRHTPYEFIHDVIQEYLPTLTRRFYKGETLAQQEGLIVEFKGSSDSSKAYPNKQASNTKSSYGQWVCGVLNSQAGGDLYIGVHDTGIVQGVHFATRKEVDEFVLGLQNHLRGKLSPGTWHKYVQVSSVELDVFQVSEDPPESKVEKEPCFGVPCSSPACTTAIQYLHMKVDRLERQVDRLERQLDELIMQEQGICAVVIVSVQPCNELGSVLFQYDDKFYLRQGPETIHMSYAMIVQRAKELS